MKNPIGAKIKKLRKAQNLKLTELAKLAGVNKGSLLHIERGDRPLSARNGAKLARILPELQKLIHPGQIILALDFSTAKKRPELSGAARRWMIDQADFSLNGELVEVYQIEKGFIFTVEEPAAVMPLTG